MNDEFRHNLCLDEVNFSSDVIRNYSAEQRKGIVQLISSQRSEEIERSSFNSPHADWAIKYSERYILWSIIEKGKTRKKCMRVFIS